MTSELMIQPGAVIGILGGGQLGRMTSLAARRMGYRIAVLDPGGENCPAAPVCDHTFGADWQDAQAVESFCKMVDVVTLEFENIPHAAAMAVEARLPLRPSSHVLEVCQHRAKERGFLAKKGIPQPEFEVVDSSAGLSAAVGRLGTPCVLKTVAFGYDGKGQRVLRPGESISDAWRDWGGSQGIVEQFINFASELSVICARTPDGRTVSFPPAENIHTGGILDVSIFPGRFEPSVAAEAMRLARSIAEELDVVGLLAVEMFLASDGRLLVNELAPRPHNSGHATFDAALTSQFEQHTRAVCGLPLGDPVPLAPCVMVNLLGDLWRGENLSQPPDWSLILDDPHAKLHLYGKPTARAGRKMGHFCVLGETVEDALDRALRIRSRLGCPPMTPAPSSAR